MLSVLTRVRFEEWRFGKQEKNGPKARNLIEKMVESAGIEPASANPLQQVLHT
jgi:hypothetical protein